MVEPFELEEKCIALFSRLGWDISYPNPGGADPGYDLELKYNGEIYGAVEVINQKNLKEDARRITAALEYVITHIKPKIFVITNGFAFDIYHYGKFYATLSAPPAPEIVDIVLGGENNE